MNTPALTFQCPECDEQLFHDSMVELALLARTHMEKNHPSVVKRIENEAVIRHTFSLISSNI